MMRATFPVLETERLTLRGPVPADAQTFMDFYKTDRSHMAGGPLAETLSWRAFAADFGHWAIHGFGRFFVTRRGEDRPIGLAGPYAPLGWPEKEIGWVLFDAANEGKGYATEAARACVAYAWRTLKWPTIVSYIDPENSASIALAKRLGATLDATATPPKPGVPCHVYRHLRPEALA
ncbi:MAG: GNAT family N-acetyltransferase [Pseudomonadota bacterium]